MVDKLGCRDLDMKNVIYFNTSNRTQYYNTLQCKQQLYQYFMLRQNHKKKNPSKKDKKYFFQTRSIKCIAIIKSNKHHY